MSDLAHIPTEARNPASGQIDELPTLDMLRIIHAADQQAVDAVTLVLPQIALAIDAIAARLSNGGRLFYTGAGTSGRLGVLDASECPPTFNTPPELVQGLIAGGDIALRRSIERAEDDPGQGARDLADHGFASGDILIGIDVNGDPSARLHKLDYRPLDVWFGAAQIMMHSLIAHMMAAYPPDVFVRRVAADALKVVLGMAYFAHPDVLAHMGWRAECGNGAT